MKALIDALASAAPISVPSFAAPANTAPCSPVVTPVVTPGSILARWCYSVQARERIMRILTLLIGAAALFAVAAPAAAASRADWDACKGDDPDRSIAACTRIIQGCGETAKDSAIAHHERALSYKSKGDFDRAIADLSEAIRLDPKYAEAYYLRGVTYRNKGDLDRAIADYSEAIRLDPKLAGAYNNRGNAYKDKGDSDHAIADFSEAIRLAPELEASQRRSFAALRTTTAAARTPTRAISTAPSPT